MRRKRSRKYVRAMLRSINAASSEGLFVNSSKTDGLRAIRLFEVVNRTIFDPFDRYHNILITNSGWRFKLNRKLTTTSRKE